LDGRGLTAEGSKMGYENSGKRGRYYRRIGYCINEIKLMEKNWVLTDDVKTKLKSIREILEVTLKHDSKHTGEVI
jgi:hypothetical protein